MVMINTKKLTIDDLSLNDYINNKLRFYFKTIKEFKGICINLNNNKVFDNETIENLNEQLKYNVLIGIENIFNKVNTDLTNLYMKTKIRK